MVSYTFRGNYTIPSYSLVEKRGTGKFNLDKFEIQLQICPFSGNMDEMGNGGTGENY